MGTGEGDALLKLVQRASNEMGVVGVLADGPQEVVWMTTAGVMAMTRSGDLEPTLMLALGVPLVEIDSGSGQVHEQLSVHPFMFNRSEIPTLIEELQRLLDE